MFEPRAGTTDFFVVTSSHGKLISKHTVRGPFDRMDGLGEIYDVPISDIIRPLESAVDEGKVESLCATILNNPSEVPPVTLLWLEGESGSNYFFGFGGCHRYNAYKKLGRETIPAILQKSTMTSLRTMMGASTPSNLA